MGSPQPHEPMSQLPHDGAQSQPGSQPQLGSQLQFGSHMAGMPQAGSQSLQNAATSNCGSVIGAAVVSDVQQASTAQLNTKRFPQTFIESIPLGEATRSPTLWVAEPRSQLVGQRLNRRPVSPLTIVVFMPVVPGVPVTPVMRNHRPSIGPNVRFVRLVRVSEFGQALRLPTPLAVARNFSQSDKLYRL